MPNSLTSTGLTVATQAELIAIFTSAFQSIYGSDINLDSDTPDGQMMMIFIQAILDVQDLVVQIYNNFDPDKAIGVVLDQRVAYNGIKRQAGTYTITPVTITTTQALTLYGLDQSSQSVYTVQDNAGNQWELQQTQNISSAGSYVMNFQAATPGAVLTLLNTITSAVTIVIGVSGINNPTASISTGLNEETDAALRIRRQKSVSLPSQGYLQGLLAALENISGMNFAAVYENDTASTNSDGVPSHSIWVIVSGTAAPLDIATAIYDERSAGCGMYGTITYTITQIDGSPFVVRWDDVVTEPLYIKFTATSLDGVNAPNLAAILAQLPTIFVPGVNAQVNVNELSTYVQSIDSNTLVTNAGFSTSATGTFTITLSPTSKKNQFTIAQADIIIIPMLLNPANSTITHLQTEQFTAVGGHGTVTYSITVNGSGGSINASSGLYTAGAVAGSDTVTATDSLGNSSNATVVVV